MIDHIFVLTTYGYSSYSYSGIEERESFYFLSMIGAVSHANALNLRIREEIQDPENECTIKQENIYP